MNKLYLKDDGSFAGFFSDEMADGKMFKFKRAKSSLKAICFPNGQIVIANDDMDIEFSKGLDSRSDLPEFTDAEKQEYLFFRMKDAGFTKKQASLLADYFGVNK